MMRLRRQSHTALAIALTAFFVLAVLPLLYMLGRFAASVINEPATISKVFLDSRQLILLGRSIGIAVCAASLAFVIGLPTALILSAKDLPKRGLFFFLAIIPLLIPPYILAGAWIHLLSPNGFVNRTLVNIFGPNANLTIQTFFGCIWCLGISFYPVVTVITSAGLSELDSGVVDTARLCTGRWGVFRYAILPQIGPHLAASFCLVMIFVLAQYGVPSLLGINTYPVEIFAQFSAFYDDTAAIALAIPLIITVTVLILLQRRLMRTFHYVRINPSSESFNPITLNRFKPWAVCLLMLLFLITTAFAFMSVLSNISGLHNIVKTVVKYRSSIFNTSLLAFLAAVFSVLLSFSIGRLLSEKNNRFTGLVDILSWLPIAMPGTIMALAVMQLGRISPALRRADSFGLILLCCYVGMFSAFAIRIFKAAFDRKDSHVEESAKLDCINWLQRLIYVDIPIHRPAIFASILVVFVLVLGELNAAVLLVPPGKATLSVSIDNLLHYGANVDASVLCLVEAVLVTGIAAAGLFIWHKLGNRKK